jgi:hypothetical protein
MPDLLPWLALLLLGTVAACTTGDDAPSGGGPHPRTSERAAERERMVAEQIEARGVHDPLVLAALRAVPRHWFVPDGYQARPTTTGRCPSAPARPSASPSSWRA